MSLNCVLQIARSGCVKGTKHFFRRIILCDCSPYPLLPAHASLPRGVHTLCDVVLWLLTLVKQEHYTYNLCVGIHMGLRQMEISLTGHT